MSVALNAMTKKALSFASHDVLRKNQYRPGKVVAHFLIGGPNLCAGKAEKGEVTFLMTT